MDKTRGHTAYSRMAVLRGTHLSNVAQVLVGGQVAQQMTIVNDSTIRFRLPAAATFQPGVAAIGLRAAANWALVPTSLTFTYVVMNGVDREMQYAFQNWNRTSSARFGYIPDNDCANFTSQAMLARGWKQSAAWFNAGQGDWSATWVSSTALNDWLRTRPDLATRYGYRDRDKVVVGDIVQFNYDGDKWWDHTAIVSRIVVLPNGRHDIYYAAHTYNRQFGGGTASLAQYGSKKLRIQFFHPLR